MATLPQAQIQDLQAFGTDARAYFQDLSEQIRNDFTQTLQDLLTRELPAFQAQVHRSLASDGLSRVGSVLGDSLGNLIENALPGSVFGDVYGAAAAGAVRSVLQQVAQGGVSLEKTIGAANRSGMGALDHVMNQSPGQRHADLLAALGKAKRNL